MVITWFEVILVASLHTVTFGIDAFWTAPGTSSILVIADIHNDVTTGTCENTDWDTFELVQSLQWKYTRENSTIGLDIFDACGSTARARQILQERLLATPRVSVVISHTKPEVSRLISDAAHVYDILHMDLADQQPEASMVSSSSLVVQPATEVRLKILKEVLKTVDWSYVTTLDDGDPLSVVEHELFLSTAHGDNVCVQYSGHNVMLDVNTIKTPGVIIYASNKTFIDELANMITAPVSVILVTRDAVQYRTSGHAFVISEQYPSVTGLADYIANEMWKHNTISQLSKQYFTDQFNCTLNATTNELNCSNEAYIHEHVMKMSSSYATHRLFSTHQFATLATKEMVEGNCSSFTWSRCVSDITAASQLTQDGTMLVTHKNMGLNLVQNSSISQTSIESNSTVATISGAIQSLLSNSQQLFPVSQCTGWCPICQTKKCDQNQQLTYSEEFYSVPGDILLLGMFPLSTKWDENGEGYCSGVSSEQNTDILVEAFVYAIQTAKTRYPNVLSNVDIGAMVLDTCSSPRRAVQLGMNFESCLYEFPRDSTDLVPSPYITPARLVATSRGQEPALASGLEGDKLALFLDEHGNINQRGNVLYDASLYNYESVVKLLHEMQWTHVGLLRSTGSLRQTDIDGLNSMTKSNNICIAFNLEIPVENNALYNMLESVKNSEANTVVLFASSLDVNNFFRALTQRTLIKTWIIVESREHLLDISAYPLPLGSIVVKRRGVQNDHFNSHIEQVLRQSESSSNPWIEKFTAARAQCTSCPHADVISDMATLSRASDVIKTVDVIIGAVSDVYESLCPGSNGLCANFWRNGTTSVEETVNKVKFVYQDETIDLSTPGGHENYVIYNLQSAGTVQVGNWTNNMLSFDKEKVTSYNSIGNALEKPRDSYCFSRCSVCINYKTVSGNESEILEYSDLDEEMGYTDSSAEFDKDLWSIIVVIIAGTGALLTIFLMLYIMCKVCMGALVRRYLVLGIMLLVAMVFMFLSVLPFVFTPSEPVCGMRYFAHGFSYAFSFAIILTKMTTLRDYRYIGLGGEISRINQMLSVLFITGVQIAIGVQWWVTQKPHVYTITAFERERSGDLVQKDFYACDFDRKDFVAYHSYILFLIVLCCFYSIGVRKETKNMKEARLLLICSWFVLAIWIALIVTLLTLSRQLLEAVCAIGLLATALTMMVVIYLPKLTAISRLKYEVEAAGRKENGYKVDPDFQFERPYSLPGTMHSSITDKTLSFPRSLAAFDTSLSY